MEAWGNGASLTSGSFSTQPITIALPESTDGYAIVAGIDANSSGALDDSEITREVDVQVADPYPLTATGEHLPDQQQGGSFAGEVATFTDADPAAPTDDSVACSAYSATIDWGDGNYRLAL